MRREWRIAKTGEARDPSFLVTHAANERSGTAIGVNPELLMDLLDVRVNGVGRDRETASDLGVGESLGQDQGDADLGGGQAEALPEPRGEITHISPRIGRQLELARTQDCSLGSGNDPGGVSGHEIAAPAASGRWARITPKTGGPTQKPPEPDRRVDSESAAADGAESTFQLIKRFRSGDQQALELLFSRHLPRLQRWARGRLPKWARGTADTQDLVQETLLQTFTRMDVFEPTREGALQAYLRQAVMNRIRDEIRRVGRRPLVVELDEGKADSARSPLEEAIGMEEIERYENALERLRPEEREMIILRVELGYTYEEVARFLEKPTSDAAHKATKRALVRLAEEMTRGE